MGAPITRRLVFYVHGYDPEAETRYRRIFMIGMASLGRRFRVNRRVGPAVDDDTVPATRWSVTAGTAAWHTETSYEILRWDDIVKRDFARSWRQRTPDLFICLAAALRDGVIRNLFRIDWHFALFVLYPWLMLLVAALAVLVLGHVASGLLALAVPLPVPLETLLSLGLAGGGYAGLHPLLRQAFVYHLLDDWIFNYQHGSGQRADIDARLDRFGARVAEAVRQTEAQEVLIVGHSTGSILAIEIAARALARDPQLGRRGPTVALLTIGAELPVVGFLRKAEHIRRAVVAVATSDQVLWVEYQAPQDVLNAFRFEPVRDLRLDLGGREQTNPHIRSARFRETLTARTYRKMKWNFFRVHFQFLMPVEIPGAYDYPMIVCGPVALFDRITEPAEAVRASYAGAAGTTSAAA